MVWSTRNLTQLKLYVQRCISWRFEQIKGPSIRQENQEDFFVICWTARAESFWKTLLENGNELFVAGFVLTW
jgi:sarcosine oxidase gamma subunit